MAINANDAQKIAVAMLCKEATEQFISDIGVQIAMTLGHVNNLGAKPVDGEIEDHIRQGLADGIISALTNVAPAAGIMSIRVDDQTGRLVYVAAT